MLGTGRTSNVTRKYSFGGLRTVFGVLCGVGRSYETDHIRRFERSFFGPQEKFLENEHDDSLGVHRPIAGILNPAFEETLFQ